MEGDDVVVSVRVNPDDEKLLSALATGSSRSEVVRRAIAFYLGSDEAERLRQFEESMPQVLAVLTMIKSAIRQAAMARNIVDGETVTKLNDIIDRFNSLMDDREAGVLE